ncbi:MAG TPA: DnaB-like helicase C-terminal domain-containing protein [Gemmatimonadaceae bacterium]
MTDVSAARRDPGRRFDPTPIIATVLEGQAAGRATPTGFPSLDARLGGGLRRGDLVVLAGDTGSGKSALALAIAIRAAAAGHTSAYLSAEMQVERLLERAIAIEGRVSIDDLRRGQLDDDAHDSAAAAAMALRQRSPLLEYLRDRGVAGVSDFLAEHLGVDLTVVDPLEALASGRTALAEEVADAARALKELAIRRDTTMLAVSHLPRSPRDRSDPRPRLDDLGGLGAIRQHADVVLGLFREELYSPDPHIDGATELHVLKNRNGGGGFVDLYFHKSCMRFEDMVEG